MALCTPQGVKSVQRSWTSLKGMWFEVEGVRGGKKKEKRGRRRGEDGKLKGFL